MAKMAGVPLLLGLAGWSVVVACSKSGSGATSPKVPVPAAVTAKGTPSGPASSATIGVAGGQLSSSDGALTVIVPAGALTTNTTVGIQPITNTSPGGVRAGFRLTPDGQRFTTPVQLVIRFQDDDLLGSSLAALRVAYQDDKGQWNSVKNVSRSESAHQATVTTTHFSDWATSVGFHIEPASASIEPGQAVQLRLIDCELAEDGELVALVATCGPSRERLTWAVNGVTGGNSTHGTVAELSAAVANYTAPAATPPRNPVAVSAQAFDPTRAILVVSNINVGGFGVWVGTVSLEQSLAYAGLSTTSIKMLATVTWQYNAALGVFRPQGNFSYDADFTGLTYNPPCKTTAHYSSAVAFEDGSITLNGQTYFGSGGKISAQVTQTSDCNDSRKSETTTNTGPLIWWPGGTGTLSGNGRTMEGSVSAPAGFDVNRWTWKFTKQ